MSDQLSDDTDGDLGNGLRANVEAERCVDGFQGIAGNTFPQQVFEDQTDLAAAANHANVPSLRFGEMV